MRAQKLGDLVRIVRQHDVGRVDLIIASPECTHHSIARGAKPLDEESRRSGWSVLPFIRALEPRWVVLENVPRMQSWPGFADMIAKIERYGYKLRMQVLDAADFGVPQTRRRLFIIGDHFRQPAEILIPRRKRRTAASILDPVEKWKAERVFNGRRATATIARIKTGIRAMGRGKDFLTVYYSSDRAGGWQRLDRPLRTLTTLDRFGLVQWIGGEPTLRMLQIPERKRAMGLPGTFSLGHGSRRDKIKLLGNGVCAPVMRQIVASLINGDVQLQAAEYFFGLIQQDTRQSEIKMPSSDLVVDGVYPGGGRATQAMTRLVTLLASATVVAFVILDRLKSLDLLF